MTSIFCRPILSFICRKSKIFSFSPPKQFLHKTCIRPTAHAHIIDGTGIARQILNEIRTDVTRLVNSGKRPPHLSVIVVGDDPASKVYIGKKVKAAEYTGMTIDSTSFPESISEDSVLEVIEMQNRDASIDGIIIQLPVPKHIREIVVCNAICPTKDVDGFHIENLGRLCSDLDTLIPCTAGGVLELIRRTGIKTHGKNIVVCGRSKNVGLPIALLLHSDGDKHVIGGDATTTICHRYTPREELTKYTLNADVIISATGVHHLITGDMVKEGVAIIDVGIHRVRDPETGKVKLVGDVDFDSVIEKVSCITPVPGGVGPMTVAMLMKNTLYTATRDISYDLRESETEHYHTCN